MTAIFSYYGSKQKIVSLYPSPAHSKVVEPFAGSARYSLLHWEKDVTLYDLSDYVIEVWRYLQGATIQDILDLPDVPSKVSTNTMLGLTQAERWLIGFHLCRGKARPRHTGHGQNSWNQDKLRIVDNLHKIKHWKIIKGDYRDIPNTEATYFVDPPYEKANTDPKNFDRYPHWQIDYGHLADWCKTRMGQVIACENAPAKWLPFKPLLMSLANSNSSGAKFTMELIWQN